MPVLVGFVPTPEGRAALRRAVLECQLRDTRLLVVNSEYRSVESTEVDPSVAEVRAACAELGVSEPHLTDRPPQRVFRSLRSRTSPLSSSITSRKDEPTPPVSTIQTTAPLAWR